MSLYCVFWWGYAAAHSDSPDSIARPAFIGEAADSRPVAAVGPGAMKKPFDRRLVAGWSSDIPTCPSVGLHPSVVGNRQVHMENCKEAVLADHWEM